MKSDGHAPPSWWVAIDGWQFDSGEAPQMDAGGLARFPLEFHWHRPPVFTKDAELRCHHIRRDIYDVNAWFALNEGDPCIDIGILVPLSFPRLTGPLSRAVRTGTFAAGRIDLGIDVTWWPGEESRFLQNWSILEVLESPPAGLPRSGSHLLDWLPVTGPERTADKTYLVNCELKQGLTKLAQKAPNCT